MKIFIENKTKYETQSIKDFLKPIVEHEAMLDYPTVFECYHKKSNILGRAYFGVVYSSKYGRHYGVKLNFPKPEVLNERKDLIVKTVIHEYAHCRGLKHKDIRGGGCVVNDIDTSWFPKELTLNMKMASVKVPRDLRKERYEKALKKLKEVEKRSIRYAKLVKKWQKKVRYYEKKVKA